MPSLPLSSTDEERLTRKHLLHISIVEAFCRKEAESTCKAALLEYLLALLSAKPCVAQDICFYASGFHEILKRKQPTKELTTSANAVLAFIKVHGLGVGTQQSGDWSGWADRYVINVYFASSREVEWTTVKLSGVDKTWGEHDFGGANLTGPIISFYCTVVLRMTVWIFFLFGFF